MVAAADGSVMDVQATRNYLSLLPLLELSIDDARHRLNTEFKKSGMDEKWLHFFPFDELVAAALTSRSKAWSSLGRSDGLKGVLRQRFCAQR